MTTKLKHLKNILATMTLQETKNAASAAINELNAEELEDFAVEKLSLDQQQVLFYVLEEELLDLHDEYLRKER